MKILINPMTSGKSLKGRKEKTMIKFTRNRRGKIAERKFQELMDDDYSEFNALELLVMYGYRDEIITDYYL